MLCIILKRLFPGAFCDFGGEILFPGLSVDSDGRVAIISGFALFPG